MGASWSLDAPGACAAGLLGHIEPGKRRLICPRLKGLQLHYDGESFVHFCSLRLQHLHTAAILQPLSLEKVESRVSQLL